MRWWVMVVGALALAGCARGDVTPQEPRARENPDVGPTIDDMTPIVSEDMGSDMPDLGLDPPNINCRVNALDEPDDAGVDLNCDGIDGDESKSVFVATSGEDSADGSKLAPYLTISHAISVVASDPEKSWVIVEVGTYREDVVLREGVNLVGGYQMGWRRDPSATSTIRASSNPGVTASEIQEVTKVIGFEVQLDRGAPSGQSAVTVSLENSSGLAFRKMRFVGASGGEGVDGASGREGDDGAMGRQGGSGFEDDDRLICSSNDRQPAIGRGALSTCGAGVGGDGGASGLSSENSGRDGKAAANGGAGGAGGASERNGNPGGPGTDGPSGEPGIGVAAVGVFMGTTWMAAEGSDGTDGANGTGGGGGGGGGGADSARFSCASWGGAGAGGGSGGCGGLGGKGGSPGGASIGVYLTDSPGVTFDDCVFLIGAGGRGGNGGVGGNGGLGGNGGAVSSGNQGSGRGGAGGRGGRGGPGGRGGGGPGGPAIGIYSNVELARRPLMQDFMLGEGGAGGIGGEVGMNGRGADGPVLAIQVGALE